MSLCDDLFSFCVKLPKDRRAVFAAGEKRLAVRSESERSDGTLVSDQPARVACHRVPEPDFAFAPRGGQPAAVRGIGDDLDRKRCIPAYPLIKRKKTISGQRPLTK